MADKILKVKCMDITVTVTPMPTATDPDAAEATIYAGSAPRMPNNPSLDLAINTILTMVAFCGANGVDIETPEFDKALRQVATFYLRSYGNPNFRVN